MIRIRSIDAVRGFVMVIMALDHTRDLFHYRAIIEDPTDLSTTSPALFFTRWVTHLCAPAFVFLSGVSAYLSLQARGDVSEARAFLFKRGIWLVILELTLVNFGIWFDIQFRMFLFQVIGAIGICFILLALMIKLKPQIIGLIGVFIILTHNLFAALPASPATNIISPLFNPNFFKLTDSTSLIFAYPPIPWLGLMLAGFGFAKYLQVTEKLREKLLLRISILCLGLFVLVRWVNSYGDPAPWSTQRTEAFTFLSFINVTKYPPSLMYDLLMLGITFLCLFLAERTANTKLTKVFSIYGKVPLFYYIIHWYLIHSILIIALLLHNVSPEQMNFNGFFGRPSGTELWPLWVVYIVWLAVVITLYPLCLLYSRYKARHPEKLWLRYL